MINTNLKPKIHFIHIYEAQNTGEMACSPFEYFGKEFSSYYDCLCHDLRSLNLKKISANDWVILGGGGLFEVREDFQQTINLILNRTYKVISWSCGHNHHNERVINSKIDYSKFFMLTVRDFGMQNQEYLPCVSCMNRELEKEAQAVRKFGIIEHLDYPINAWEIDKISNSFSIYSITKFISESECIITNSYHCLYWASLMKKKVLLYEPFSSKFSNFEFKPVLIDRNTDLNKAFDDAVIYEKSLQKCREMNENFKTKLLKTMLKIDF